MCAVSDMEVCACACSREGVGTRREETGYSRRGQVIINSPCSVQGLCTQCLQRECYQRL